MRFTMVDISQKDVWAKTTGVKKSDGYESRNIKSICESMGETLDPQYVSAKRPYCAWSRLNCHVNGQG